MGKSPSLSELAKQFEEASKKAFLQPIEEGEMSVRMFADETKCTIPQAKRLLEQLEMDGKAVGRLAKGEKSGTRKVYRLV